MLNFKYLELNKHLKDFFYKKIDLIRDETLKPQIVTKKYPQVPWSEIAKVRDILTHHYFRVDDKILWDTLDEDFDKFEKVIKDILSNLDK